MCDRSTNERVSPRERENVCEGNGLLRKQGNGLRGGHSGAAKDADLKLLFILTNCRYSLYCLLRLWPAMIDLLDIDRLLFIFFGAWHVLARLTELTTSSRHAEGPLAPWVGRVSGDGGLEVL